MPINNLLCVLQLGSYGLRLR